MRPGRHLTLIGYGASTWTCLEAADELAKAGVEAEVVDLRTLVPYDEETVLASVKKTGRALVVHEAQLTLGFGAEVAARLADAAFPWLDAPDPPRRLPRPAGALRQEPGEGAAAGQGQGAGGGAGAAGVLR